MTPVQPYLHKGVELDQIAVKGVRVTGYHGVNKSERDTGQLFLADIVAHVNTRGAAAGDALALTVNYSDMADRAAEILAGDPADLLETVAEHISRAILEMEGVLCVDVTVHKPQAPLHVEFKDVTVSIRRDLRDGGLWANKRIGSSARIPNDPLNNAGANPVQDPFDELPAAPVRALLALGGNLGKLQQTFAEAVVELSRVPGITVVAASDLVSSRPEDGSDEPDYVNAVVRITTTLAPRELLAACHGIEMVHGRDRSVPNASRTLDLDIIHYGDVTGTSADLTLPHPRAHVRAFVLAPWLALEPHAQLVGHGAVSALLEKVVNNTSPQPGQWTHAQQ
jgi:dihydroneopterin aldolase/2-amino-4-hydroxy-6-hydroxymethyldihydropteridine diphosphokinase